MEELSEQQKLAKAKMDGMQSLAKGIAVDFMPVLSKIKKLVDTNAPKEEIFQPIDTMLSLIAQLEKFCERTRKMEKKDE